MIQKNVTPSFQAKQLTTDVSYDFARHGIWKNGQFPFEWMYSHSVLLSNSVVTGCKPKVVRFLRVQILDRFRRTRTLCLVIPSPQHSLHCDLWTAHKTSRSHQSLHHLLISLEPVLKAATAATGYAPFRRFVKAGMALATRCWEIWAQQSLRRSFRLSTSWIFTARQPLQLSPDE